MNLRFTLNWVSICTYLTTKVGCPRVAIIVKAGISHVYLSGWEGSLWNCLLVSSYTKTVKAVVEAVVEAAVEATLRSVESRTLRRKAIMAYTKGKKVEESGLPHIKQYQTIGIFQKSI